MITITPLHIKYCKFQIEGITRILQNKWTDSAIKPKTTTQNEQRNQGS